MGCSIAFHLMLKRNASKALKPLCLVKCHCICPFKNQGSNMVENKTSN